MPRTRKNTRKHSRKNLGGTGTANTPTHKTFKTDSETLRKNREWKKNSNYFLKRREMYANTLKINPEKYEKYIKKREKKDEKEAAEALLKMSNMNTNASITNKTSSK
jgi:hypothetical protein